MTIDANRVVVSQPVHQHAYESAFAAEEVGLLQWFITGLYRTGRGLSHPALLQLLPEQHRLRVIALQRRRWHPNIPAAKVVTIAWPLIVQLLFRRSPVHRLAERWAFAQFDKAVGRRLLRYRPAAIIHAFEGTALETFRAAKHLGVPTVLDVPSAHEYFRAALAAEGQPLAIPASTTMRVRAERELADHILAPSPFVVRCLLDNGVVPERVISLAYGVDTETFKPRTRQAGRFRALFVGQIGLRKGVRYLLEAWRQLALPDAELVLVGACDDSGRALLTSGPRNCRWVGQLPKYEVHHWFNQSDVFVFPSLAEGSAYVTYEAMAAALPLITTANSGSVARDNEEGCIVPAADAGALAEKIQLLYEQPALREHLGRKARHRMETSYTWGHYRTRLGTVYRAILQGQEPNEALVEAQLLPS